MLEQDLPTRGASPYVTSWVVLTFPQKPLLDTTQALVIGKSWLFCEKSLQKTFSSNVKRKVVSVPLKPSNILPEKTPKTEQNPSLLSQNHKITLKTLPFYSAIADRGVLALLKISFLSVCR
jgi:hypothetical protein